MPQVGTLSGNPVAACAGLATLQVLKQPGTYEKVFATGRALMDGIREIHAETGLVGQVSGEPPMFDVAYAPGVPRDYRAILRADEAMQKRINQRLRAGGVLRSDSKYYVSLAHDAADIAHTLGAYRAAVKAELMEAAAE